MPSDHASRNAPNCKSEACQVCSFIARTEDSVVCQVTIQDVISGKSRVPFTSRPAWQAIQTECPDLRHTHTYLKLGTHPSKKMTNIRDVKRYLNVASISRDGLLIVRHNEPLAVAKERILVPCLVLNGLLTALHIQLGHPSCNQLKTVFHRYFYALDMDKEIERSTSNCPQCAALRKVPHCISKQSTEDPPDAIGVSFAADVLKCNKQLILVVRECVTSYTMSTLLESEKSEALRDALICLCVHLRPMDGPPAIIRTDPAPGFVSLREDELLHQHRIGIEVGRVKNPNKNPVAERAVQELEEELLRHTGPDPSEQYITPRRLAVATASLNARIRSRGLSAREMWSQRDQFTNDQIPITDHDLIMKQHQERKKNHEHSEASKAPKGRQLPDTPVSIGDLVYLYSDRNKMRARNRYLVTSTDGLWCSIRKFSGSQLRATSYRIKRSECYRVPSSHNLEHIRTLPSDPCSEPEEDIMPPPPQPPDILSTTGPFSQLECCSVLMCRPILLLLLPHLFPCWTTIVY